MPRRAGECAELTLANLHDLPGPCRDCVFWELDPAITAHDDRVVDGGMEKEAWLSDTLLQWGRCGQIAYVEGRPAGYVLYAPPAYVPRAAAFPTAPVSPDAVLLVTGRVLPGFVGRGVGRVLVQTAARDMAQRGVKALEAFGATPALMAAGAGGAAGSTGCLLPEEYLRAVGFKVVRPHPLTPRLRLDTKVPGTWKAEIGEAVDRLLAGPRVVLS